MQKVGNTTDTADANGEYTNGVRRETGRDQGVKVPDH